MSKSKRRTNKLTQAEQRILDAVNANGAQSYAAKSGRGVKGGKVEVGYRDYDAAMALLRKGLVTKLAHATDTDTKHGNTIIYRNVTIGRKNNTEVAAAE